MCKQLTFNEWIVSILNILDIPVDKKILDKNIDGRCYYVTIKQFFNIVLNREGWQPVIMEIGNHFCTKYLIENDDITEQSIAKTRFMFLDYISDFSINAIKAGYPEFNECIINTHKSAPLFNKRTEV